MNERTDMTVAMLLSCDAFESFFGHVLKLDRQRYLTDYRSDWSWYYARGLLDNGIRPLIYVPSLHESGRFETDTGIPVRFLPLAKWYKPLARFRRACRATRWSLYAQERVNAVAMMKPLRRAIDEDDVDVLYVQEYWGGRYDHLAHRVQVPITAADHGGLAEGVVKWFKRSALRKAPVLYGQTADECRKIEAHGGRCKHLPNGCDVVRFCPDPTAVRGKTVLTIARLTDKQKRTSDLIRAMRHLSADWTLDVVGTGPDRGMLEALAATLGVSGRVRFHGFQDREAVRHFLRHCGVYAMPSSHEGFCIAMLEAMGCGAAVVGTHIRAFEQVIDDDVNGLLVPVSDVPGLAAAIEVAWKRRDTLGAAAVRTVTTQYDTRMLYQNLADSLRAAANVAPTPQQPAENLTGALA